MNKLLIILYLLPFCCLSQGKAADTMYIVLPESNKPQIKKMDGFNFQFSGNGAMNNYQFIESSNSYRAINILTQNKPESVRIKVKRKKFLGLHKDKILDLDVIARRGLRATLLPLTYSRKTKIFLINEADLKKRKLILKEAFITAPEYIDM